MPIPYVDGRTLVPDLSQSLRLALGLAQQQRDERNQEQINAAIDQAIQAPQDQQMEALGRIAKLDMNAARGIAGILQTRDERMLGQLQREADDAVRQSTYLLGIDDQTMRMKEMARLVGERQSRGQDVSKLVEIANLPPDEQNLRLRQMVIKGTDAQQLAKSALGTDSVGTHMNVKPLEDGRLYGQNKATGAWEIISPPPGTRFAKPAPTVEIKQFPAPPSGYYYKDPQNPAAGLVGIEGGPADKLTEGQALAAGFADRMTAAEDRMGDVVGGGFDPASAIEHGRAWLGNYAASQEFQLYRQAQEDWVRAKLRKESGAVIGPEEMAQEIQTYFAQHGDSDATIKAKQRSRKVAEMAMRRSAGQRYQRETASSRDRPAADLPPLPPALN